MRPENIYVINPSRAVLGDFRLACLLTDSARMAKRAGRLESLERGGEGYTWTPTGQDEFRVPEMQRGSAYGRVRSPRRIPKTTFDVSHL